jgi:hypothetical protein
MGTKVGAWMAAAVVLAVTADAGAVDMYCVDRDGRCMTVTVNGQAAVKLTKPTKAMLKGLWEAVSYVEGSEMRDTRYEVPLPIRGPLQVTADGNARSRDWFGVDRSFETMVTPIDPVDLKTRQQVTTADGVSVGGAAPLVVENVLESNRLPPGRYVLRIRLTGSENWDRMVVYVRVEE